MEPQTPQLVEVKEQKHVLHQVTPLSKYLAMALFIILPFVGGWIGYVYAPEKVVEVRAVGDREVVMDNGVEKSTAAISDDLAKYLNVNHFANYNGVSQYKDYFAYIPPGEKILKVVDLKNNKIVKEISANNLTFLEFEYDRQHTEMLPDDNGKAIFIDMADACECELDNEAIVVSTNEGFKVFPLPSAVEFQWLVSDDLKYRYKRVLPDPQKCVGVEGICVGVKVVDEWVNGQINLSDASALDKWDGRPFNKN